jgi:hypothetical protein
MKTCATHTPKFSFVLTKSAQITIILSQTVEGKTRVAARVLVNESAGAHSYTLPASYSGHGLAAGTYQITAQATTSSQHSSVFHAQLRVR